MWLGGQGQSCPVGARVSPAASALELLDAQLAGVGVRARCPPIRIVMVEHTRPVSVGFPSGHGGVRLARRVICKVGFLLGPGAWWEQWVLPSESAGSAGSGGREKEALPFPVGQEAGSHSRARGTVSLNCPRGSQSGRVLQQDKWDHPSPPLSWLFTATGVVSVLGHPVE